MRTEGRRPVGPGRAAGELLERDVELEVIGAALEAAGTGIGAMLVVEGTAGIGKSSVLERARALARARGLTVLASRGTELERIHPFGVAHSLFDAPVRAGAELLGGAAAPAQSIFDPSAASGDAAPRDRQTLVHALYWLTINLAERGPLLLAVDDAHWADEASLEYLAYLGRRVRDISVVLLVGMRPTHAAPSLLSEHVRSHPDARRLPLAPLTEGGVDALIHRSSGDGLDPERRADILSATGGNPFYVVELLRSTTADVVASSTSDVSGHEVPDTIQASIRRRLSDQSGTTRSVAEAIAVLGDEADLERVARLTAAPATEVVAAVRLMTDRALLDADRLSFIHPIVHTAVISSIPHAVRERLHLEAARTLAASGATAIAAAGHLLETTPSSDPALVALLRNAGRAALSAGDAAAAARFLTRALQEGPERTLRSTILLELARAESASGAPAAPERFEEAIAGLRDHHERAQARLAQGHTLIAAGRWPEAMKAFDAGLAQVDSRDVELKSRLEAGYISSAYVAMADPDEANERLQDILSAPLHDPAHRELAAWTAFQQTMQLRGRAAESASLARRAVSDARLEDLVDSSQVIEIAAGVFLATGDLLEEVELLTRAMEAARGVNAYAKSGVFAYCRSLPFYLMGRLQDAIADGQTAVAAHVHGWETFYPGACAALAWAHLERGDVAAAEAVVAIDDEQWGGRLDFQFMTRVGRARVAWARGKLEEALAEFQAVRDAGLAMGVFSTHVLADWRTWSAVLLRAMHRRTEAVELAEEALVQANRWDEPMAIGRAQWALGISLGGPEGIDQLRGALARLETTDAELEITRVTLELGAALRRGGSLAEAREMLMRAADRAHRLGALAMLERARSALAAAGARPRRYTLTGVESLTPSELRVARMAAGGDTNRAIAQSLFVTPKAVEYHLGNVYRKLGITSRGELSSALAQTPEATSV